jgi:sugar (pentulose or hexulose) kinase
MTLALGIDIGTTGVRTAVREGDRLVAAARVPHVSQPTGRVDATAWWHAVEHCLTAQIKVLRQIGRHPSEIRGIAVDGTTGSMVLTDAALRPVGPALMYNSKGFEAEAARLDALASGPNIAKGSNGALARAMRLVSLAERAPAHLLHQADFIAARLMGQGGLTDWNNARKTGLDPQTGRWPDWIDQVIDPGLLPRAQAPGTPFARIAPEMALRFGLSRDTVVHAGTTDSVAAVIASAPIEPGNAVTSLGSTLVVKLVSKRRIEAPALGLFSHRLGDMWLVGGASNSGCAVLRQHFSDADLARLSARIDPNTPQNLGYYPLPRPGERFPTNDPNMQPQMAPRPREDAAFLQGLLEGMATIEAQGYAAIATHGGGRPRRIYTTGGGARNTVWTAIRARLLGQMPLTPQHAEAAMGAAKLACAQPALNARSSHDAPPYNPRARTSTYPCHSRTA